MNTENCSKRLVKILTIGFHLIFPTILGPSAEAEAKRIIVKTIPLALNEKQPEQTHVGSLHYRGGLVISSTKSGFGGFSALGVSSDGKRMIAISDMGYRFAARLIYNKESHLIGPNKTELDSLAKPDGTALKRKAESDIESMCPGVDGEIIISFERQHRIWRYFPGKTIPEPIPSPVELDGLPKNAGVESLALLKNGSLFAIAEGFPKIASTLAWVSNPNGWSAMTYVLDSGFHPSGAATLPNGDVLVLERRFTLRDGVAARIRRITGISIQPGAELSSELLAEFRNPVTTDNFEGIAIRQNQKGQTMVYIISDDNFNPMQRTLLMMFELKE